MTREQATILALNMRIQRLIAAKITSRYSFVFLLSRIWTGEHTLRKDDKDMLFILQQYRHDMSHHWPNFYPIEEEDRELL